MALPLMFKDEPLGALTVQSADANAFSEEDATALQSLANQIAIAIHNARLVRRLDAANQEIIRSKTFEAIATATGEAIHWVGNKAAPVPASVQRVREDLLNIMAVFKAHLDANEPETKKRFLSVIENVFTQAQDAGIDLSALMEKLSDLPDNRLSNLIGLESILEDLQIIENSAKTILNIKEDLLGPARQRNPVPFSLADEIKRIIANMRIPGGVVIAEFENELPPVYGDPRQLDQVYNNLIKNAWEALESNADRRIYISVRRDPESGSLISCVRDNGPGIPPEALEKIWVSFYTTKMGKGGTGLGLSACMEIVRQNGGSIWVESKPGQGAAFFVRLPVAA
jgi:signal transduction histidine kinase